MDSRRFVHVGLLIVSVMFIIACVVWGIAMIFRDSKSPGISQSIANGAFSTLFSSYFDTDNNHTIQIIHFNDVYQLKPTNDQGGLSHFAKLIELSKKEIPKTMVTLAGDFLSPSMESTYFKGEQMIDAFNNMNVTVASVGNHEFDWGMDVLANRARNSTFPWVNANVKYGNAFLNGTVPYYKLPSYGINDQICFFGVLFDLTVTGFSMLGVTFLNPYDVAAEMSRYLKHEQNCTIVIALTHQSRDEDCALAGQVDTIDLILGGHEHEAMMTTNCGHATIFKSTMDAERVWKIKLVLNSDGTLQSTQGRLVPLSPYPYNTTANSVLMDQVISYWYKKLPTDLFQVIGSSAVPLTVSYTQTRIRETNLGNFLADVMRNSSNCPIAIIDASNINGDGIFTSKISKSSVIEWIPRDQRVVTFRMTGDQLRSLLQWAVSLLYYQDGRFPQISGFRFSYLPASPPVIVSMTWPNGADVLDSDVFRCATLENYKLKAAPIKTIPHAANGIKLTTAVIDHIINAPNNIISPQVEGRITQLTTQ